MAKRVLGTRIEFYNPTTGVLRYTITDDVRLIDIEENARDEADDATIELANPDGAHTGQITEGDKVKVYIQLEGEASLSHIWTGIVDTIRTERRGHNYADIVIQAQDFVYYRLAHTYTTDAFENETAGAIVRSLVANEAPDVSLSNVEDTTTTVPSISFNGSSLLQAIRRIAELAGAEWTGDKDGGLHFFEKGARSSGAYVDASKVVRGTFRVETSMAGFGNVIKVRGGSRAQLDKENPTFSSYSTLTGTTRKMARVYVSKSSIAQVELWTNPTTGFEGDLRIRVQADNETGTAPIEEANADRDLTGRTLSQEFLAAGGWTTFLLPAHTTSPGGFVWLIVECATDSESQQVGVDASGGLLYRTYYPVPVIVERIDQTSIDTYGERELPPINDRNVATEEEANLLADMTLARSSTPQRTAEYEVLLGPERNLVTNSSFELGEVGWTRQSVSSGATLEVIDYPDAFHGGKVAHAVCPAGVNRTALYRQLFPVVPGKTYDLMCRAKYVNVVQGPNTWNRVYALCRWFRADQSEITGIFPDIGWNTGNSDGWEMRRRTGLLAPPEAAYFRFDMGLNTCQGEVWFDGIQFREADSPGSGTSGTTSLIDEEFEATPRLRSVPVGYVLTASFPADAVTALTQFILMRKRHSYDADNGVYTLTHELADAERVVRVEDLLMRVHERVRRVEDSLMGRSKGEIVDLIRTIRDTATVSDFISRTEAAVGSHVVGTAEVGFSSVG